MSTTTLMSCNHLSRHFGGLVAVKDVSLSLKRGTIQAVIGTNGAGKSTLINLLSGELKPSSGQVNLLGQDVSNWSQAKRAQTGLGRSYQRNTVYPTFTVLENCRLSAQAHSQRGWAIWINAQRDPKSLDTAREMARLVGLEAQLERPAGFLSHGQKRQLEIAMCLATSPRVLLLDEPLAGMGAEESERMLALLIDLKREHAILLVEHDMDAVFKISDLITVMVNGSVIASGTPEQVRSNPLVRTAYLGEHA